MEGAQLKKCFPFIKSFWWKYVGSFQSVEIYQAAKWSQGKELRFLLAFDENFPNTLPTIYLLQSGEPVENIPHLLNRQEICYLDPEGVIWDEENPIGIIEQSVEMAYQTISKSLAGASDSDYLREFDFHWKNTQKAISAISLVGDLKVSGLILMAQCGPHRIIGATIEQIKDFSNRLKEPCDPVNVTNMLYIPLTTANGVKFKKSWNLKTLRQVVFGNIGFASRIKKCLRSNFILPVYITMPASSESRVHFAAEFGKPKRKVHPLLDDKIEGGFGGILVNRMDKAYLFPRGGVKENPLNKKVCIIGCGAIGGAIVQELAKAGITDLTLIDPDVFSKDNLYRHVLGMPYIGLFKVNALKDKLEKDLPHVNISAIAAPFEKVAREKKVDFPKFDLVIDATAVVAVSSSICRFFINDHPGVPLMHVWLEALGVGGHAMVTNNGGKGCYKCLYTSLDPETGIYNRASFAAPGQNFAKSMFGCAGRFTPFSSLDAQKTAILAVELGLKILSGEENGNPLLSWKGSDKFLLDSGFKLSDRYKNFTEEELYKNRFGYSSDNCQLCMRVPA